ncbi:hypothetical protein ACQRD6_01165 [Prevotella sp. SGI.027]
MSKERRIIEIEPGRMAPGGRMTDHIESRGHSCPYCQGNGYHWQEDEWQERYKKECPICKGSGRLDAMITIEWKAGRKASPAPSEGGENRQLEDFEL